MEPVEQARPRVRDVLGDREFRAMTVSDGLSVVGDQIARIAVALLVLDRTGSAFAAAATYAVSYLTWLLGAPLLSPLADRYRRRRVMIGCDLARAALVALIALPGSPLWLVFLLLTGVGVLTPPFESARSALVADVLEGERYVVGNAVSNTVAQGGQLVGFLAGGALVHVLGQSGALFVNAATFVLSALVLAALVQERPVHAPESASSLLGDAAAGARLVTGDRRLWVLLGWGLLSAFAVIAPEGLAAPIAREQGGGALSAGVLTAAVPAGFVLGSFALLRLPVERRTTSFGPLVVLSCLPLAVTPLVDSIPLLTALWVLAGVGNALQLLANSAFVQAVPAALRGRAFGFASTALMLVQGLVLLVAGGLAEALGPRLPVTVFALLAVLLVPVMLAAQSRSALVATGPGHIDRGPRG